MRAFESKLWSHLIVDDRLLVINQNLFLVWNQESLNAWERPFPNNVPPISLYTIIINEGVTLYSLPQAI